MIDYGQFCTVARGAEVLGELWTPLVVRELLCGSRRFNDIRRGVPRMSATLLTQRLRKLEEMGVVERRRGDGAAGNTTSRRRARSCARSWSAIGHWGARWIGSRLKREQLDAGFLMWDIRRFARSTSFPGGRRVVIHFRFTRRAARRAAVVAGGGERHRRPVPRRSRPRARRRRRIHRARADRDLDRRQRPGDRDRCRAPARAGRRPRRRQLWRWLGRSMFAPSRRSLPTT